MWSVTNRKTGKYKNALILMRTEVAVGCGSASLVVVTTVDEGSGSIGKRFVLHFSSVQHSATQRAKYSEPERVSFLWLQAEVVVQLPADAEKQPRMPTNVPFVNSAVNAMHLNINEMITRSQSNATLRTPQTKRQLIYMNSRTLGAEIYFENTTVPRTPPRGEVYLDKCRTYVSTVQ